MKNKKGTGNVLMSIVLIIIALVGTSVLYDRYFAAPEPVSTGGAGDGGTGPVQCGTSNARVTLGPVKAAFNPATSTANVAVSYLLNGDISTLQSGKSGDIVTVGPNNKLTVIYALDQALDNAKPANTTNPYYSSIVKDIQVGCDDFSTATKDPAAATLMRPGNLSFVTKSWDGTLSVVGLNTSVNGSTNTVALTLNDNKDVEFTMVAPSERGVGIKDGKILFVFQDNKSVMNKIALSDSTEVTCPSYASTFAGAPVVNSRQTCYIVNSMENNVQRKHTLNLKTLGTYEPDGLQGNYIYFTFFPEDLFFDTKTGEVKKGVEDDQNSRVGFNTAAIDLANTYIIKLS